MKLKIKQLRQQSKMSQGDLAFKCGDGWDQGRISHYETGRREPSLDDLTLIAKALNVEFNDLFESNSSALSNIEPTNHKTGNGKVPEISYVQAGEFTEVIDIYEPGYADQWHPRIKEGSQIYVLRVRGDSMTSPQGKSFPEGMLLHVNPENLSPDNGDYVIAKVNGRDDVTFKQFKQGETSPYLQPLNIRHDPIYEEFSILGVVVFAGWEL